MAGAGMLAAFSLALATANPALATATTQPPSRYASIVMDAETGNVLYERNADLPRHPASLTKIMTLYLTFEALAAKTLAVTDMLPVSQYAAEHDPSRLDLVPGTKLKVEDAIRAITTKSANDAACVLAERLSGSEAHFAEMMTAKGKALGMKQTAFHNASGLPCEGHTTSARDLALLSKALIHDYPQYYTYFSTPAFDYHGTRFPNQNRFLNTYYGADGIKTGFVNASGHNLAASAVRGGKRLIAIVMGGDSQPWTREHAMRLLDVSYAKIDPSLAMVATNASTAKPAAATPTKPVQYATPAGAVSIASTTAAAAEATGLPLPNATANLAAYAAAAATPNTPAGSVPPPAAATAASAKPIAVASIQAPAKIQAASDPATAPNIPVPAAALPEPAPADDDAPTRSIFSRMLASILPSRSAEAAQTASPATAAAASAPSPAIAAVQATAALAQPTTPGPGPTLDTAAGHEPEIPLDDRNVVVPAASQAEIATKQDDAQAAQPTAPSASPSVSAIAVDASAASATAPVHAAPSPTVHEAHPAKQAASGEESKASSRDSDWSVQVGLFREATIARRRGEEARAHMPLSLRRAELVVGRAGDGVHIASRISHLTEHQAREACGQLQREHLPCVVVPPGRPLIVATN